MSRFDVPGLAGMTSAETAGMIFLCIFVGLIALGFIAYGVMVEREKRREAAAAPLTYDDFRSTDRQYNKRHTAPISDAGFGANRSKHIIQDPAGYWRTAQAYEAPIGYARVPQQSRMSRPLALTAATATGYRTDPRQTSILGLQEPLDVVPISPPMYAPTAVHRAPEIIKQPVAYDDYFTVAPTSPAAPSVSHYAPRPVSMARDDYPTWDNPAPVSPSPYFNPLGQEYVPQATVAVSVGRHARSIGVDAIGTTAQRHWTQATGQLDLVELRQLLEVG